MFGHSDAYLMFTRFAAKLEEAGLADRFPEDPELRNLAIELLAEHEGSHENVVKDPALIEDAVAEARAILEERRG